MALEPIVSAVIPVFGLVLCGFFAGKLGIVGAKSSDALNQFVFFFALPAMLFVAVSRGSLTQILNFPFLATVVTGTLICAAGGFAISAFAMGGSGQESALRGLNASFGNTGYLGIPLLPVSRFAELLAGAAGPAALFALGLFVSRQSMGEGMTLGWPSVLLKLVLHPIITAVLVYHVVQMDPLWAKIAVVCASLPLGATAFVLAQRYKVLELETSCSAVLSTALSVLTVSAVMAALASR